ncbi:MAG: choice-of-anchor tandem repeat GloVer-containing protein [Candidatus Korobacteraceae bacterium]
MHGKAHSHTPIFGMSWSPASAALATLLTLLFLVLLLLFLTLTAQPAHAQTFQVIHDFTDGADGALPDAGLIMDSQGNLYGTTYIGGTGCSPYGCGVVFQMSHNSSGWTLTTLYSFQGSPDGAGPDAAVFFGPDGNLYGTTTNGGVSPGCGTYPACGTVFSLRPPSSLSNNWTEAVLYRFKTRALDADQPFAQVVFDGAGNMYSTTPYGGSSRCQCGAVYKLTRSATGWKESILYSFRDGTDGKWPFGGLAIDSAGNLYGTTSQGGATGLGTVFQLSPSGSGWTVTTLYSFQDQDGGQVNGSLVFDQCGNLYGATLYGGNGGGGTVFKLTPTSSGWVYAMLYALVGNGGPGEQLTIDLAGNIYGTTAYDGAYSDGNVFKLSPSSDGWTYTSLYDFTGGTDGDLPISNVTLDASGNLYGTTYSGGAHDEGVVWEITP